MEHVSGVHLSSITPIEPSQIINIGPHTSIGYTVLKLPNQLLELEQFLDLGVLDFVDALVYQDSHEVEGEICPLQTLRCLSVLDYLGVDLQEEAHLLELFLSSRSQLLGDPLCNLCKLGFCLARLY